MTAPLYEELEERLNDGIRSCDEVLQGLVFRSAMWGPPIAQELQFILMCETKMTLHGRFAGYVKDEWTRFVASKVEQATSVFPYAHECAPGRLTELMRDFLTGPYNVMLTAEPPADEPACNCICHTTPNVKHVTACCAAPPMEDDGAPA